MIPKNADRQHNVTDFREMCLKTYTATELHALMHTWTATKEINRSFILLGVVVVLGSINVTVHYKLKLSLLARG